MANNSSEAGYTVVLTALEGKENRAHVARRLARMAKNLSEERILARLENLPWTLTRTADKRRVQMLLDLIQEYGGSAEVFPPLSGPVSSVASERAILPEKESISKDRTIESRRLETSVSESDLSPESAPPSEEESHEPPGPTGDGPMVIEPLSLGGILDRTFQICRAYFWKLMAIVIIPWLVTVGLVALAIVIAVIAGLTGHALGKTPLWILIVVGVVVVPTLVAVLVAIFYLSQGALIHAVSSIYVGRRVMVSEAYRYVLEKLGKFVITSFLFILVCFLLLAASSALGIVFFFISRALTSSGWWSALTWPILLIGPVYVSLKMLLFDKVVIIEDQSYGSALKRSWELLSGKADGPWPRGYLLRLLILLWLFVLINLAISLLFGTPSALLAGLFPEGLKILAEILGRILSSIGNLIAGLFGSVGLVVFYYDIRNRKEGFDLKTLAQMYQRSE
jgi:hypothetical protein